MSKEKEESLRHILGMFLSLETLAVCVIYILESFLDFDPWYEASLVDLLRLRLVEFTRVIDLGYIILAALIIFNALALRFKVCYIIYEIAHIIYAVLVFINEPNLFIFAALICWRGIVYFCNLIFNR